MILNDSFYGRINGNSVKNKFGLTEYVICNNFAGISRLNKKFWEELISLLSLHKLAVNNIQRHHLHTKFNLNLPIGSKVAPTSEV
jgi:hypothetical protein